VADHVFVGYTRKPFGVKGALKLKIEPEFVEDVLKADVLFIEISGGLVPYFVESFKVTADLIVKFEDLDIREKAAELVSRSIYLHPRHILAPEDKEMPVETISPHLKYLHYQINDLTLGAIGQIDRIEEYPQQDMAFVAYEGREVMIPLHEDFVVEEDIEGKKLVVDLPEGLLSL